MNIIIDIGHTRTKAAIFDDKGQIIARGTEQELQEKYPRARVFSSTNIGEHTRLPIKNCYSPPSTLGADRIAAAVGAHARFPNEDVLIVDLGTAITIDMVTSNGEFLGGNISPGAAMRFRALHEGTKTLPLCELGEGHISPLGNSTHKAIVAGVVNGIVHEIEGYMRKIPQAKIIFTGGDAKFFAERMKSVIFVDCELVLYGLNRIAEYNE